MALPPDQSLERRPPSSPTLDALINARNALGGDNKNRHETNTALKKAALGLSTRIEEGPSSPDPQAYSLKRLAIDPSGVLGAEVRYVLERPADPAKPNQEVVIVTRSSFDSSGSIVFLDPQRADLNDRFAANYARNISYIFNSDQQAKFLDDVIEVYSDIEMHGIRKDQDEYTIVKETAVENPAQYEKFIADLPLTKAVSDRLPDPAPPPPRPPRTRPASTAKPSYYAQPAPTRTVNPAELRRQQESEALRSINTQTVVDALTGLGSEPLEIAPTFEGTAIAYRPTVSLNERTVTLAVLQIPEDKKSPTGMVYITVPIGNETLTPQNVGILRSGSSDSEPSLARKSGYGLLHATELIDSFRKAGATIELGKGALAQPLLTEGSGREKRVIHLSQAQPEQQAAVNDLLRQAAERMKQNFPDSIITPAIAALGEPRPAEQIGSQERESMQAILNLLTGRKVIAKDDSIFDSGNLFPQISLNNGQLELSLSRRGTDQLQISMPLGGVEPSLDNISIGLYGLGQARLDQLDGPVLEKIQATFENILKGQMNIDPYQLQQLSITVGDHRGINAANASNVIKDRALELIASQRQHNPDSPFSAAMQLMEGSVDRVNPDVGPFGKVGRVIESLAGYVDAEGKVVAGSLLSAPLDTELLATLNMRDIKEYVQASQDGGSPTEQQSLQAVAAVRRFLTSNLLLLAQSRNPNVLWFPNPDGFALQRGVEPVTRTHYDFGATRGGGSLRVGQANERGDVPLQVDGRFTGIDIETTRPEDTLEEIYEFVMVDGVPQIGPDGQPAKQRVAGKNFRPAFKLNISEETPDGKTETYSIWRAELGTDQDSEQAILIQCAGSDAPTLYTSKMVTRNIVSVTRKPVIYLYPKKASKVKVSLKYQGRLTNTYPRINGDNWVVNASPDGILTLEGKKYKYIFWDGVNDEVDWDFSEGFSVHRDEVDNFLEEKTEKLGLNFSEAQDFITYWGPIMKLNEWTFVSFQTNKYEELAKLTVTPKPSSLLRVFMVFKKIKSKVNLPEPQLKKLTRKGFTVVEWGGANLDEIQLQNLPDKRKPIIGINLSHI